MMLIISQTHFRYLESDQPAFQPLGAAWRASDPPSILLGSAACSGISGFHFWQVIAHAARPWLVTGGRAVPGIAQEDVQEMHRSEWWWSPGASGQSCMQKAFLTYSGLKLMFSASVFELLLKNVPGEMICWLNVPEGISLWTWWTSLIHYCCELLM